MVIKMNKYPLGLFARTEFFRVVKSVFTKECESFILSRMKATSRNVKPVIIVDDNTKECICKIPNNSLTALIDANDTYAQILCVRVYQNADYMVQKFQIQKSNKTKEQKTKAVDKLLKKD
tara:strand:- start:43 stop:402 length:360 start_codon:yes stop_codon:yes gene_type:complete